MYIRIPLWNKALRALQERSHNTYSLSVLFGCNKQSASAALMRLARMGYAKRDKYGWYYLQRKRIDSFKTNGFGTNE